MMQDTAQLYHQLIMERSKHPRHAGRPEAFDAEGQGDNPMCGDTVHVYVASNGMQVSHDARGCAIMLASVELMADAVAGLDGAEVAALRGAFEAVVTTGVEDAGLGELNALAGVAEYRSRIRCATLPWSALAAALDDGKQING